MLPRNVGFAPAAYAFRATDADADAYLARLLAGVEAEFARIGPARVAAFVAETVSGSTLACATAPPQSPRCPSTQRWRA